MVILDEILMTEMISRHFVMSHSCIRSCKIFRFQNLRNDLNLERLNGPLDKFRLVIEGASATRSFGVISRYSRNV